MTADLIHILLVEDNPGDVRLTREALKNAKILNDLSVCGDGEEALQYLRHEGQYKDTRRPDLILLDLNLPIMDGRELLSKIKQDPNLSLIPVVVLTSSAAERDIVASYELHANCYVTKPVQLNEFMEVVASIKHFWLGVVKLPPSSEEGM